MCRVCVYKVNVHSGQHIGWALSSRLELQSIKPNEAAELRFGTEAQAPPPARRHTNTLVCVFFVCLYTRHPRLREWTNAFQQFYYDKKKEKKKDSSHSSPEAMSFFFFFKVLFSSALGVGGGVSSPSPQISHALQS